MDDNGGCGCGYATTLFVSNLIFIVLYIYISFLTLPLIENEAATLTELATWIAATGVLVLIFARYQRSVIAVFLQVKVAYWEWVTLLGYLIGVGLYVALPVSLLKFYLNPLSMFAFMLYILPSIFQSYLLSRYVRRSFMWVLANIVIWLFAAFAAIYVAPFAQGFQETGGEGMSGIILIYVIPVVLLYIAVMFIAHSLVTASTLRSLAKSVRDDVIDDDKPKNT